MSKVSRFEDLLVWKQARELANIIYDCSSVKPFSFDSGLQSQIRRAAVSILSNIAEGFERNSDAEFARFLLISKGSAGEVRAQLYIAFDRHFIDAVRFNDAKEKVESVSRLIAHLLTAIKRKQNQKLA